MKPITEIDFCVSFIGENAGLLAQVCFETLGRYCDLTCINIHLINKQVSNKVWSEVMQAAGCLDVPVRIYNLDTGWSPYRGAVDQYSYNYGGSGEYNDAARTAEWVVNNCGDAEWCILSHFDVIWRADIVKWLKEKQQFSGAMMVGSHCPIMLLNRGAYQRCGVKFDAVGGQYDVGVILGRALNSVPLDGDPGMEWCFHHMGGGGSYHSIEEFDSMRQRAREFIEKGDVHYPR